MNTTQIIIAILISLGFILVLLVVPWIIIDQLGGEGLIVYVSMLGLIAISIISGIALAQTYF